MVKLIKIASDSRAVRVRRVSIGPSRQRRKVNGAVVGTLSRLCPNGALATASRARTFLGGYSVGGRGGRGNDRWLLFLPFFLVRNVRSLFGSRYSVSSFVTIGGFFVR